MKKFTILPLILVLFTIIGCTPEPKGPSNLSVGKSKLINSGLAIDAVDHLLKAEIEEKEEEDKSEARALLLIAYSHGLATGDAKRLGKETEYRKQRTERIAALNTEDIDKLLEILSKQSQIQKTGLEILADNGSDAAVAIVNIISNSTYPTAHADFISVLVQIGSNAIDPILDKITDTEISSSAKLKLIRVLGDIGDKKALDRLKSIDLTNMVAALKMEVLTTLYRLGENKYKSDIIDGLSSNEESVRRAAAKAMGSIRGVSETTLISSLKDSDSQVVTDIANALSVHKTKNAVMPLADILKSEYEAGAKQAVIQTLTAYTEAGLSKGLAKYLSLMIINEEVSSSEDRVRIVQFLKHSALVKQLKAIRLIDDIDSQLYEYSQNEQSAFVKTELNDLLELIRK